MPTRRESLEALLVEQPQDPFLRYGLAIDIKRCVDRLDRAPRMRCVQHRVKDRSILRLLRGWLRAGVQEDGGLVSSKTGTPQGGVMTPRNAKGNFVFDRTLRYR